MDNEWKPKSLPFLGELHMIGLKVHKSEAEVVRRKLLSMRALSRRFKSLRVGDYVVFPLEREVKGLGEIIHANFKERKRTPPEIEGKFDIIGDIALISRAENEQEIAKELMKRKNIRVVAIRAGHREGEFRKMKIRLLAGENRLETIHRENKCVFKVNIGECFFDPRLSYERREVAKEVKENERVLDMFAGVGPFSIVIGKLSSPREIISVEKNQVAFSYLKHNIKLNKLDEKITPILGDSRDVVPVLPSKFHRIIMNLPERSKEFLPIAEEKLADGGVIYLYSIGESPEDVLNDIHMRVLGVRRVKSYSPKRYIFRVKLTR